MRFLASFLSLIIYFIFFGPVFAAENQFITIVNPIRGTDFFQLDNTHPLDNVKKEWEEVKRKNLPATWLVRPDALSDTAVTSFLKSLPLNQEIGLFMEITPSWAEKAGVKYHPNQNWHAAGSVFLTGYEVFEREKLIDTAFERFKNIYGYYPKSVGAWWIDAGSLSYMRQKYQIVASMDVADQYTTDNYQVWGQFFSTPFYPAKRNALAPAQGLDQKIGVVTIQWATRDPFNSYGNGVLDSTYSVQANDYANSKYHSLSTDYFKKLVSIYLDNPYSTIGQVTVGLENDFSWQQFGKEYTNQLEHVLERQLKGVKVLTMSQFAKSYNQLFPGTTPSQIVFGQDPLGSGGAVLWYQNLNYRVGWFYTARGSQIRDLRVFQTEENCLTKPCENLNLASVIRSIDEVTYKDEWLIDGGRIANLSVRPLPNGVEVSYLNQSGIRRSIAFLPNDVSIDGNPKTVASTIAEIASYTDKVVKEEIHFAHQLKDGWGKVAIDQLKNLLIFGVFSVLFFLLPGLAILKKTILKFPPKIILSWPVGLSLFTLCAFIVGYLHFVWILLTLPILSIIFLYKDIKNLNPAWNFKNYWAILVIGLGSISWLLTSVKNGLIFDYGMGFWGPHGHDGIWHLSLIEGLKEGLPLKNPAFAGETLKNYHFFYDLLLSATGQLSGLSSLDLYFRLFPLLIAISIGVLTYLLVKEWSDSKLAAILSCFFLYFGGSFGWVISFFKDRSLGGETYFWAQQSISTLINPPFAISLVLFLSGLYIFRLVCGQKKQDISLVISLIILWGTLIEFKSYGGLLVLGSLSFVTIYELIKGNFNFLKISLPVGLLSLIVFLPNNWGSFGLITFMPFWLIHSMVDSTDRLNWTRLSLARMSGIEMGDWFKYTASEVIGLVAFLIGNMGTRIVGILWLKWLNLRSPFGLFIFVFSLLSVLLPLIFIQKGAAFNIVQFFYYFLLIFNLLAGVGLAILIKKVKVMGWIIAGVLILLTLPTTWDSLHHYLPARPPARIPSGEIEALNFLKSQPEGVVLSYYFDSKKPQRFGEPVPLFAYTSTSYVSAISGKSEYIADTVNLDIINVDYKGRLQAQKDIFSFKEALIIDKILKEGNIKYLYLPKKMAAIPDLHKFNLKNIYKNDEVEILEVVR